MNKRVILIALILLFTLGGGIYSTCRISEPIAVSADIEDEAYIEKNIEDFDEFITIYVFLFLFIVCPVIFLILIL